MNKNLENGLRREKIDQFKNILNNSTDMYNNGKRLGVVIIYLKGYDEFLISILAKYILEKQFNEEDLSLIYHYIISLDIEILNADDVLNIRENLINKNPEIIDFASFKRVVENIRN